MSEGDEEGDEIDELRKQTRGTDRISADAGDGTEEAENEGQEQGPDKKREQSTEAPEEDRAERGNEGVQKNERPTPSEEFEAAFEERARRTSSAVDPRTVSARDPALSALLLALQDSDGLEGVGRSLTEALGAREPPEYDRDTVVRLAVAYALQDTAPEYFEKLSEHV